MAGGAQAYFSNFHPATIYADLSQAAEKFKSHYNIPSLSPFYYANPTNIRPYLEDPDTLRNVLRLVVIVAAYLLLRPHLDRVLKKMGGAPEGRGEVLRKRVEVMKARERGQGGGEEGKGEGRKEK